MWLLLALAFVAIPPTVAEEYLVYSDAGLPKDSTIWIWCGEDPSGQGLCQFFSERFNQCANPEGSRHLNTPSNSWAGFGVFYVDDQLPPQNSLREDLSSFIGGDIRFWAKSASHDFEAGFQCDEGGGPIGHVLLDVLGSYGVGPSPDWQEIVIPIADIYSGVDLTTCLQNVSASFTSTGAGNPTLYQVDNVRWRKPNTLTGATTVTVSGRQLLVDGEPFVVKGVAYSPQSIGENFSGGFRDRPDLYSTDFAAIAASGANTIRIYSTFLTNNLLNSASANGLYVIPTFQVDPLQFGCDEGRAFMQDRLEEAIAQWKGHPAILMWMLGNEISVGVPEAEVCDSGTCTVSSAACSSAGDCSSGFCSFNTETACDPTVNPTTCPQTPVAQTCIPETCSKGWYAQLEALAAAVDVADPDHPTGTSNADVGAIGYASCSDDTGLPSLDVWGVNLYRGCTFSSAFSSYSTLSGKPLLITEFGSDSWNTGSGSEDQALQASCVTTLLAEAESALAVRDPAGGVSTGQILFSWMDEWWKNSDGGSCANTYWDKHDTCTTWQQFGYPDPNIQEEWWGIAKRDTYCSDMTTPCVTDDDCPGAPGTCSIAGTTCRLDSECPGTCSFTTAQACTVDSDCPGLCSGNPPTSCSNDGQCSGPQICIFGNERCDYEPCNQSACNVVLDETVRVPRTSYDAVADSYQLGAVLDLTISSYDDSTGIADITFDPAAGSAEHRLRYGPLNLVSTYGYTGVAGPLGASGSSTVTLPAGSLFFVVVGDDGNEGCYGVDSECVERPGSGVFQDPNRNCSVPQCP
jgi:hypothetical protein